MRPEEFEALVAQAIAELPEKFHERLENVAVVVEDWPSTRQLASVGLSRRLDLLGLYEGIPRTKRGSGYNLVLPDRITIFRRPIEARCAHGRDVVAEVQRVVLHEIAHHFGLSDEELASG